MEDQMISAFAALLKSQKIPLLPREVPLLQGQVILDVACGEGEWVNALGFELDDPTREGPDGYVVGVDSCLDRIELARIRAKERSIENVSFLGENLAQMNLPDNTYDLVHLQGLAFRVPRRSFSAVLAEAVRVLCPGGMIVCSEFAWPRTNALACQVFADLIRRMLEAACYSEVQVDQLGSLLYEAGCEIVCERSTFIDLSARTEGNWLLVHRFLPLLYFLSPLLKQHGFTQEGPFMKLYRDLESEMLMQTFRAEWPLVTVIGEKPH
jgi:ubiquinone/menaquinone biosynthesis C-methylase UbiE